MCTDEAKFFANDRVNEIGVRLRKVEKFLFAFHKANAGKAARAHGNQRLNN